jgi:hypothetical protein
MLKGTWKSGENLDSSLSPQGKRSFSARYRCILSDIHVVKLGSVARLNIDLLGHFSAGIDPVALESAEDAIEAARFYPEPVLQSLNNLPMGTRVFQVNVERGRIGSAAPFKPLSRLQSSTQPLK